MKADTHAEAQSQAKALCLAYETPAGVIDELATEIETKWQGVRLRSEEGTDGAHCRDR